MIDRWSSLPYEIFLVIADTILESAEEQFRPKQILWRMVLSNTSRQAHRVTGNLGVVLGRDESEKQKAFFEEIRAISQVNQRTRAAFRRGFSLLPVASVYPCHAEPPATPRCVWASNKATFLFDLTAMTLHNQTPYLNLLVPACFQKVERLATPWLHDLLTLGLRELTVAFPGVKTVSVGAPVVRVPRPAVPHDHDDVQPLPAGPSSPLYPGFPRGAEWYRVHALRLGCLWESGIRILGYGCGLDPWSMGHLVHAHKQCVVSAEPLVEILPSSSHSIQFKFLAPRCECYEEDSEDESEYSENENQEDSEDDNDQNNNDSDDSNGMTIMETSIYDVD